MCVCLYVCVSGAGCTASAGGRHADTVTHALAVQLSRVGLAALPIAALPHPTAVVRTAAAVTVAVTVATTAAAALRFVLGGRRNDGPAAPQQPAQHTLLAVVHRVAARSVARSRRGGRCRCHRGTAQHAAAAAAAAAVSQHAAQHHAAEIKAGTSEDGDGGCGL